MDLHKIKQVKEFKEQCKRYGVHYTDVARDCEFNVRSFESAVQSGSISRDRIEQAFKSLQKLVRQKGLEYRVQNPALDANAEANLSAN